MDATTTTLIADDYSVSRILRGDRNKLEVKRRLRAEMTAAERTLWEKLRAKQFLGLKFRRQHGIGPFVADFFCPSEKLVIEVDGPVHDDPEQRRLDIERSNYFSQLGVIVIRYSNESILNDLENELAKLQHKLQSSKPPPC